MNNLISLKYLKMNRVKNFLDTEEKVRDARKRLEDSTEETFRGYTQAKGRVKVIAQGYVLD